MPSDRTIIAAVARWKWVPFGGSGSIHRSKRLRRQEQVIFPRTRKWYRATVRPQGAHKPREPTATGTYSRPVRRGWPLYTLSICVSFSLPHSIPWFVATRLVRVISCSIDSERAHERVGNIFRGAARRPDARLSSQKFKTESLLCVVAPNFYLQGKICNIFFLRNVFESTILTLYLKSRDLLHNIFLHYFSRECINIFQNNK